jgi:hypothetical protein
MTSTNGIHKDWETLPPLKDPATLTENSDSCPIMTEKEMNKSQVCIANMKPTRLFRCQDYQITDEEYKQTLDISGGDVDPDALDLDKWENVPYSKTLEEEQRLSEKETANYYQKIKDGQLLKKEETAQYFRELAK